MNAKQQNIWTAKEMVSFIGGACFLFSSAYVADLVWKFKPAVVQFFHFPHTIPGDDPPWYFMRQDFVHGVCALGVFLTTLAIAAVGWKRFRFYAELTICMSITWQGGEIIRATIIYFSCPNFLYPTAVSRWPTFDSYLDDPAISLGRQLVQCAGSVLAFYLVFRRWRTKPAEEATDH